MYGPQILIFYNHNVISSQMINLSRRLKHHN
jgi:hypothetical protein